MDYKDKKVVWVLSLIQHYNHENYWKMRDYLQNFHGRMTIKALWYLLRIKRMDAFSNASTGVALGEGGCGI